MVKIFYALPLFIFLILNSNFADASLSVEQTAYLQKAQTYLDDANLSYAAYPVDMCGHKIPTKIDSSLVEPFMKANLELKNYCEEVRTKLALICRDGTPDLQAKVKTNIKTVTCKLASKVDEISFQFSNGNLQASFSTKASDIDRAVLKYIETGMKNSSAASAGAKKND